MSLIKKGMSTLHFIGVYAIANVQAAMEYRVAFLVQVLSMFLSDSLWLFFWWSYFHQFPLVHGWQITNIVILWSVSATGFGLCAGIFGNARSLAIIIMNGSLDVYLGMPRYALLHLCIATTDPTAWGDVLFGFGAYIAFLHPDVWHILLFGVLALHVCLIFTAFLVIFCSLSFFIGNTDGLTAQMFGALISFSTYPMEIFNGAIRFLLFTIIPAGFVSFIPLQLLRQFAWPLMGALTGFTLVFVALAAGLFQLGLRRYESGNLLGMQG